MTYQYKGPCSIPEYNFPQHVWPTSGEYRWLSTVRSHEARKQSVGEFGTVVLHDAKYFQITTADANIVRDMVSGTADFPKLGNRDI